MVLTLSVTPTEEQQLVDAVKSAFPAIGKFIKSIKTKDGHYEAEIDTGVVGAVDARFELQVPADGWLHLVLTKISKPAFFGSIGLPLNWIEKFPGVGDQIKAIQAKQISIPGIFLTAHLVQEGKITLIGKLEPK